MHAEILGDERAMFGKQVVNNRSDHLTMLHGREFRGTNRFHTSGKSIKIFYVFMLYQILTKKYR